MFCDNNNSNVLRNIVLGKKNVLSDTIWTLQHTWTASTQMCWNVFKDLKMPETYCSKLLKDIY